MQKTFLEKSAEALNQEREEEIRKTLSDASDAFSKVLGEKVAAKYFLEAPHYRFLDQDFTLFHRKEFLVGRPNGETLALYSVDGERIYKLRPIEKLSDIKRHVDEVRHERELIKEELKKYKKELVEDAKALGDKIEQEQKSFWSFFFRK